MGSAGAYQQLPGRNGLAGVVRGWVKGGPVDGVARLPGPSLRRGDGTGRGDEHQGSTRSSPIMPNSAWSRMWQCIIQRPGRLSK